MTGFDGILEGGPLDGERSHIEDLEPPAVIYAFVCQHDTDGPCDLQTAAMHAGERLPDDALGCDHCAGSHWFFLPVFPHGDPRQHAYDFNDFAGDGSAVYRHRTKTREGHHA